MLIVLNGNVFGCAFLHLVCTAEKEWVGGEIQNELGIIFGITVLPLAYIDCSVANRHVELVFLQCFVPRL